MTSLDVSALPAIDAHCHPFEASSRLLTRDLLRDSLSLSMQGGASPLNETTLLSRIAIGGLAEHLGCEPTYEAVIDARNAAATEYDDYIGTLWTAQGISGLLIDPGYPDVPYIDAGEFAVRVPHRIWEGYRIERFFPTDGSFHGDPGTRSKARFAEVLEAFQAELDAQALRPGFAFYKSVMAYCTGLAIAPVRDDEAATAWEEHRTYGDAAEKPIRDYLFRVTCAKAREHGVPFQLHTGHTSTSIVWPHVNPILLTPVLNEPDVAATELVLVHGGYPYCAEAGYLTSIYPNVYCDLSLMIPWASIGAGRRILETFEAAPVAKVLYGSDGIHIPEMHWLGALVGRQALAQALGALVGDGVLAVAQAEEAAADILSRNAERIYALREREPVPGMAPPDGAVVSPTAERVSV